MSGAVHGSAFAWLFDNSWNDLLIFYSTGCSCQIDCETNRKMQYSSNITECQDTTTGRNLRKKKTAISRYVNHVKNVSASFFRIILNSRMISLSAPEWWVRKTELLLLSSGAANDLIFLCFPKIPGTMYWLFVCPSNACILPAFPVQEDVGSGSDNLHMRTEKSCQSITSKSRRKLKYL